MHINNEYKLSDLVSLVCSADDGRGMVTAITITLSGSVLYGVSWGDRGESTHSARELDLIAVADDDFVRD